MRIDNKYAFHSFLALGCDVNGRVHVWEKMNQNAPYRVAEMDQVYKLYDFPGQLQWEVRELVRR